MEFNDVEKIFFDKRKFGSQLKKEVLRRYKSVQHFADWCGVSYSLVKKWFAGKRVPTIKLMLEICTSWGIPIDYFFANFRRDEKELFFSR